MANPKLFFLILFLFMIACNIGRNHAKIFKGMQEIANYTYIKMEFGE